MAFGDIGGPITELVITCQTPSSGAVSIHKGDALKLTGDYTVTNVTDAEDAIFGQALGDASENNKAVSVKVRGICTFAYTGDAPAVDGVKGVVASAVDGSVKTPASGNGTGINVYVNSMASTVDVLL